jgi:DNA-binding CsgD family transcriptional regulator
MLFGREEELRLVDELLGQARRSRSATLVLRGDPGIGKSALLAQALEHASDMTTLMARGVESESQLPFAGLHQLLAPALPLIDRLPGPQAEALRAALGMAEPVGQSRFLISVACLSLLSELAEERPVLCLVDDAQWIDTPSAEALLFVARRLAADGIVILFAARDSAGQRFEARDLASIELTGIESGPAAELVRDRAPGVAPHVEAALVERAAGNALALFELPASLSADQLAGREPLPESFRLTPQVESLFTAQVRRLPTDSQRLLALVAADTSGLLAPVFRAAVAQGITPAALDAAEVARLVTVRGPNLELRHPLIRSAILQTSASSERRAAHLALAEALTEPEEADRRAWHRAAAVVGWDAEVADELERTADSALRRGGHGAAASALERSAALSPDAKDRSRRMLGAAASAWRAGQPARATALLDQARATMKDPGLAVAVGHLSGSIKFRCGSVLEARGELITAAEAAADTNPRLALEILFDAGLSGIDSGDYGLVARAGRAAALLPRHSDDQVAFLADLIISVGSLCEGKTAIEVPLVLDVVARSDSFDDPRWLIWAAAGAGLSGLAAREAEILARASAIARTSGAVDLLTYVLVTYAVNGVVAGRLAAATEASEGLILAREAGLSNAASIHLAAQAWFAAATGDDDTCLGAAAAATSASRDTGEALANAIAEWALALRDLCAGRVEESQTRLMRLHGSPVGIGHPLITLMSTPDLIEACVRAGNPVDAEAAYVYLSGFASTGAPSWAAALAARCRALMSDDPDHGAAEFNTALLAHEQAPRPFDQARTRLLLGEHLRRARRRVDAREHLRAALESFELLGARPWAERARTELRASGETARKRDPGAPSRLSPQELQVGRLVAAGQSNKAVAAQLLLSPRTIDAHLRSIFAKLEITSRMELTRIDLDSGVVLSP